MALQDLPATIDYILRANGAYKKVGVNTGGVKGSREGGTEGLSSVSGTVQLGSFKVLSLVAWLWELLPVLLGRVMTPGFVATGGAGGALPGRIAAADASLPSTRVQRQGQRQHRPRPSGVRQPHHQCAHGCILQSCECRW